MTKTEYKTEEVTKTFINKIPINTTVTCDFCEKEIKDGDLYFEMSVGHDTVSHIDKYDVCPDCMTERMNEYIESSIQDVNDGYDDGNYVSFISRIRMDANKRLSKIDMIDYILNENSNE